MKPIVNLKSIAELCDFLQLKAAHPLVAVVDFGKFDEYVEEGVRISADFYSVMFKNYCANNVRYGRQAFDFKDGSLICIAPRQVLTMDSEIEKVEDKMGWGIFFHPDLLLGTSLSSKMNDYSFFDYETSEALHLSDKEKNTLFDCIQKIENELQENIDDHSQTLIVSNIELLLNYCLRYYGRQFITRKPSHSRTLAQVEKWLKQYFQAVDLKESGLPSVKMLADHVHLSPSYLSDLLKKETGMNAQEHIHYYLIEQAKNILLNSDHSVSEVAYSLGFDYPQYFSKLFKKRTGKTPVEFRSLN